MHKSEGTTSSAYSSKTQDQRAQWRVTLQGEKKKKEIDRLFDVYECLQLSIDKKKNNDNIETKTKEAILTTWKQVIHMKKQS